VVEHETVRGGIARGDAGIGVEFFLEGHGSARRGGIGIWKS
jgi:hypothetical protein